MATLLTFASCFLLNAFILIASFVDSAYSASFYGSSHVSLPVQESRTVTKITFRFKTIRQNGLVILTAGSTDYFLVGLEDGLVKVRVNLGSGEAWLSSVPTIKLNDNQWHEVIVERLNVELTLTVDGGQSRFVEIPGDFSVLNVRRGLLVGGYSESFFEQEDLVLGDLDGFRGCIERLKYNGLDVIESAFALKDGMQNVDFECSSEFEATNDQAVSFVDGGAFFSLEGFDGQMSGRNGASFELDIKTSSMSAIVIYVPGSVTNPDTFVAVEVLNGRVALSTNDGGGVVVLMSDVIVNDGYWHRVGVIFSAAYMEVTVDGKTRTLSPANAERKFYDLSDSLYMGGLEPRREFEALQQGLNTILSEGLEGASLIGCLRNIEVNRKSCGLREAKVTKGLKASGCFWEFVCLLNEPCIPEADCFQEGLDDFHCLCDSDSSCVRSNYTRGRGHDAGGSSSYGPVPGGGPRLDGSHSPPKEKKNRKDGRGRGRKKDKAQVPGEKATVVIDQKSAAENRTVFQIIGPTINALDITMSKEQIIIGTIGVTVTLVLVLIVLLFREFCLIGQRRKNERKGSESRTGTSPNSQNTMSSPTPLESDFDANDLATLSSRHGLGSSSHAASPSPSLEVDSCLGSSHAGTGSAIRSVASSGHYASRDERTGRLVAVGDHHHRRHRDSGIIYPLPPPSLYFGHEGREATPLENRTSGHCCVFSAPAPKPQSLAMFKQPYATSSLTSHFSPDSGFGTLGRHRPKNSHNPSALHGFNLNSPNVNGVPERALGDGVSSSTGSETQLPSLRRVPWSCEDLYRASESAYCQSGERCANDIGLGTASDVVAKSRQQQQGHNSNQYFEPIGGGAARGTTFHTFSPLTPMPQRRQHYWI